MLKKTNAVMVLVSAVAILVVACDDQETAIDNSNDVIAEAQKTGNQVVCGTAEPFLQIEFNFDGTGQVRYRYPDGGGDRTDILTRVTPNQPATNSTTFFELSNGMTGEIVKTADGSCEADMLVSDPPNSFEFAITRWPNAQNISVPVPKFGCCEKR